MLGIVVSNSFSVDVVSGVGSFHHVSGQGVATFLLLQIDKILHVPTSSIVNDWFGKNSQV